MRRSSTPLLLSLTLILTAIVMLPGTALCVDRDAPPPSKVDKNKEEIKKIVTKLKKERQALRKRQGQERSILSDLQTLDRKITQGEKRQNGITSESKGIRRELPELERKSEALMKKMAEQRRHLRSYARIIYGLGEQGVVKLALSQQNTSRVRQGVLYFSRLMQSRNEVFKQFHVSLEQLKATRQARESRLARLKKLSKELKVEQASHRKHRRQRKNLLSRIRKEKGLHERRIRELKQAKKELKSFVSKLQTELERRESAAREKASFGRVISRKGRLPRPTKGRKRNRPPGLFFKTSSKTAVKSVFKGQVVYADWFRGYGLLLILNHGQQIYSLYGHNRRLLVSQGDWVESGEKIAEVGDTGSLDGVAGLYFEIRRKGGAVNPRHWLGG
ncbi:MAG: peptidoglycan DD-metalloendopeptidase family protein [Magnetococcales bacterium]|nr:peptidoglycan DD-metalloendopeptidase family protein [Magnetococcales bacterium]